MAASSRPGMGALPYAGGVTFRVWAPFASAVSVAGSFNGWNPQGAPLTSEGNGYWSVDVAGAQINDQYKFVIANPDSAAAVPAFSGKGPIAPTWPHGWWMPCPTA